jgi:hypothetical protein
MKKQIEVGNIYPTQDGEKVQILCTDLTEGFAVLGIRTDKHGGKHLYRCNAAGKCHYESIYGGDLILPDAEPEYRAWTFDEVPVGAVIRRKEFNSKGVILAAEDLNKHGVPQILLGEKLWITYEKALEKYEVFQDGTWKPCGVQI